MIKFQFKPEWAKDLIEASQNPSQPSMQPSSINPNLLSWLNDIGLNYTSENLPLIAAILIRRGLNTFAHDGSLYGLFTLISSRNRQVSPFTATHDYHIRIEHCDLLGRVTLNISPIYRLGPEYPEHYKLTHGKELERSAIIGLLAEPDDVIASNYDQQPFSLGIDAGIAFKESNIPHNKQLILQFDFSHKKISATIHCDDQTMSKTFNQIQLTLDELTRLDMSTLTANDELSATLPRIDEIST